MQIISNVALISINETLLVQMFSFLLFLYIMNRIMFRPLRNVMGQREDHIAQVKTDTVAASRNYDELTEQIKGQESAVRSAAFKVKQEKEDAASQEAAKILAEVQDDIRALRNEAEADVARQVDSVKVKLAAEADALAIAIMEKVLDRRLSQ